LATVRPRFFRTKSEFADWLERNHATAEEVWVGYYRKATGRATITWAESVDVALQYGWIDGVRKRIDDERYTNRFTPRGPKSTWSLRNIERARELIELGEMHPAGLRAFEARADERSAIYSYEQRHAAVLDPAYDREFRRNKKAWAFFASCPPSYRKAATHWVMSAKREETRRRRLARLIEDSAEHRRIPPLTPPGRAER
jgi:uncharacterized protein YdeI (YjbR/CyaY-like superfamily)